MIKAMAIQYISVLQNAVNNGVTGEVTYHLKDGRIMVAKVVAHERYSFEPSGGEQSVTPPVGPGIDREIGIGVD